MTDRSHWILVVGYGSIGRRHFRSLQSLGCDDVRLLRTGEPRPGAFESPPGVKVYHCLADALADGPWLVVVANPTSLHADAAAAALKAGANVLLEKPVAGDMKSAQKILAAQKDSPAAVSMAYCFRYHMLYRQLHDAVKSGRLGRVFHAHTWQASYLPSWHPWEDYHASYAARAELGGGVVRTLDHDLDMIRWVMGQPVEVLASSGAMSGIAVEVEDTADMIFRFAGSAQACAHVSFGRRDYCRGMWVVGEAGSANLDWNAGTLTITTGDEVAEKTSLPGDFELGTIYVDMLRDALAGFAASPPRAAIGLWEGVAALEMALAALASSENGKSVSLKGTQ